MKIALLSAALISLAATTAPSMASSYPSDMLSTAHWPKANTSKKQYQKNVKREYKNRHKKGRP